MNKLGLYSVILLAVTAFSLFQIQALGGLSSLPKLVESETILASNEQPIQPTIAPTFGEEEAIGFVPQLIDMPSVNLSLPVVSVPLIDGTWQVNDKVANYAQGTSLISPDSGNVGIYGHDRVGQFRAIKQLQNGDLIVVSSHSKRATYEVVQQSVIDPENVAVFLPTANPQLTLITCDGLLSEKRFMVIATLISTE